MKKRLIIEKALFMIYLIVCISICFSLTAKPVSAQVTGCCQETNNGEICIQSTQSECKTSFSPFTSCSLKPECSDFVCCEIETASEHNCYANTLRTNCQNKNGIVHSDKTCSSVNECLPGCCILGSQYQFITQKQCSQLSNLFPSLPKEFRAEILTEEQCIKLKTQADFGCCIEDLSYKTRGECTGIFHTNKFCSQVTDICSKHSFRDCYENNIYWFDSCGNREELVKDCKYSETGNLCKNDDRDVYCYDLGCKDTFKYQDDKFDYLNLGGKRKHGDAWCVYESPVGGFRDRPGSRHYRHICINGEEIVEPCEDYRQEICIETTDESNIQYATCIANDNSSITGVPQGFDFWDVERNEDTCAASSYDCKIYYLKKSGLDDWDLVNNKNAQCRKSEFRASMAEYCKSLGDCGMDYNIVDEFSDKGFFWTWTGGGRGTGSQPAFPSDFETANKKDNFIKLTYINWTNYGIYSGIKELSLGFTETLEELIKEYGDLDKSFKAGGLKTTQLIGHSLTGIGAFLGITLAYTLLTLTTTVTLSTAIGLGVSQAAASASPLLSMPVYGWIIFIAVVIVAGLLTAGGGKKSKTIHFNCLPWQAPTGGQNCELCTDKNKLNELGYETCTEYRCKSLGATCEYDDSSGKPVCFDSNPYDVTSAKITPLIKDYKITEFSTGYKIDKQIPPYQTLQIGIETDKYTTCRYSEEPNQLYEQMYNHFGNSYRKKQHVMNISLEGGKQFNYYIRCESANGITNQIDYKIQLETSNEPDLTPPIIQRTSLIDYAPIKSDATETEFSLYLNEPANCKWSRNPLQIAEPMICDNEPDSTNYEYECITALSVRKGQNTYYFTCEDLNNNKMSQPYKHNLIGSEPLEILSKGPQGKLEYNDVTLLTTTSNNAECQYSISNIPYDKFINTGAKQHTHPQTSLQKNKYTYKIKCIDQAGNIAEDQINFEITADTEAPKLLYTYKDKDNFYIILNEESNCKANNEQMTGTNSPLHSIEITQYKYKVICEDKNKNTISNLEIYP